MGKVQGEQGYNCLPGVGLLFRVAPLWAELCSEGHLRALVLTWRLWELNCGLVLMARRSLLFSLCPSCKVLR